MIFQIVHRPVRFRADIVVVLLMGLIVSACGVVDDFFEPPPPPPCPSVSILGNAERITQFRSGPGRDLIDITAEARMEDFIAQCFYEVDEETGVGQVLVELSMGITAARGAANVDGVADIPYFVTMTKLDKTVLTKKIFTITTLFTGNRYRVSAYDEPVILSIPIEASQSGRDFLIYVGFQLTPDQLEYNLSLRQSGG